MTKSHRKKGPKRLTNYPSVPHIVDATEAGVDQSDAPTRSRSPWWVPLHWSPARPSITRISDLRFQANTSALRRLNK